MHPLQIPPLRTVRAGANAPSSDQAATTVEQTWRALLARNITVIDIIAVLDRAIARGKAQI